MAISSITKKKYRWLIRPLLCFSSLSVASALMFIGINKFGTADVVPQWLELLVQGSFGWFFFDRTLTKRLGDKEQTE